MEPHVQSVGRLKSAAVRVTYGTPRARPVVPLGQPHSAQPSVHTPAKRRPSTSEPSESSDSEAEHSQDNARRRAKKPLVQTTLLATLTPSATCRRPLLLHHPPSQAKRPAEAAAAAAPPPTPRTAETQARREQTFLDFGQKPNAPEPCAQCGMAYQRGRAEDEQLHVRFHRSWARAQRNLLVWGADLDVAPDAHGICVVDARTAARRTVLRALEIVNVANEHLGAVRLSLVDLGHRQRKVFLRVAQGGRVEGCVLAECIEGARRLAGGSPGEPAPAACGISRIWVAPDARRTGVASGLVDAVCRGFVYGCPLSLDSLAFTQPTADGRAFARRLFGRDDFLVYAED
ncbi:hypothetical protein LPJ53_003137 [Coemansia erecta]|uniref:Uncharacterized protein n=1 Tax=Coemansia erecta TaxID=147472 RepID=A0A9W7Y1U4_9FUNG|nr:hypothetical protein LPJ53_003137 [Coemansia erecta]